MYNKYEDIYCSKKVLILRGDILLYVGIIFILLGLYSFLSDIIDMSTLVNQKAIVKRKHTIVDGYFKLKLVVGSFSIIVGILSIANYLLY